MLNMSACKYLHIAGDGDLLGGERFLYSLRESLSHISLSVGKESLSRSLSSIWKIGTLSLIC